MSHAAIPTQAMRPIPLADAEVYYLEQAPLGLAPGVALERLIREIDWRAEEIVVWGRRLAQPRLIAWHGEPGRRYVYSGLSLEARPWTALLAALRRRVEEICAAEFDCVLLNYYRDHRDSMGMHSDDEPELGERPVIASLSFGAERVFAMKHRRDAAVAPLRLRLASGSLLLMKGETQTNWKHGVAKQARPCGARVNLTFRRIAAPRDDR